MTGTVATLDPALPAANDSAPAAAPALAAPLLCPSCGADRHAPYGLTPCAGCGRAPDAASEKEAA